MSQRQNNAEHMAVGVGPYTNFGAAAAAATVFIRCVINAWPGATAYDLLSFPAGPTRPAGLGWILQATGSQAYRLFLSAGRNATFSGSNTSLGTVTTIVVSRSGLATDLSDHTAYTNGVAQTLGLGGGGAIGDLLGWMLVGNRYDHTRPSDFTVLECGLVNRACTAQEAIDLQTKDARTVFNDGTLESYVRAVGPWMYDVVKKTSFNWQGASIAGGTVTGTFTQSEVVFQQYTGAVGLHARVATTTLYLHELGPSGLSGPFKRFVTGPITGRFEFGEIVTQTGQTGRGFFAGVLPLTASTNVILLFGCFNTHNATGALVGNVSGATTTPTAVADATTMQSTLKAITASGGSGTYTFNEVCNFVGGGSGRFMAETGGVVYLAGATGTLTGNLTGASSAAVRTTSGSADYTAVVTGQTSGATLTVGTGVLTAITPAQGSDKTHTPTVPNLPGGFPSIATLCGYWETTNVGKAGHRLFEMTDLSGTKEHLRASGLLSMPGIADMEPLVFVSHDNGRNGVNPTIMVTDGVSAAISQTSWAWFGILSKRNTGAAERIGPTVVGGWLETDANGRAQANIGGATVTLSPAIYPQARFVPTAMRVKASGEVKVWLGTGEVATGTHAVGAPTTGTISQIGGNAGSLGDGDYQSWPAMGICSGEPTDAELVNALTFLSARFTSANRTIPLVFDSVTIVLTGSSTGAGTQGQLVGPGQTGDALNRDLAYQMWVTGAFGNGRVFNTAVFGHTFANMTSIASKADGLYANYPGQRVMVSSSGINDIYGGTAPATVQVNAKAYHDARKVATPGLLIIHPTLFRRDSDAQEANRVTYNGYSFAQLGADSRPNLGADTNFSAVGAQNNLVYYSGDGFHLSVTGTVLYASYLLADVRNFMTASGSSKLGAVRARESRSADRLRP